MKLVVLLTFSLGMVAALESARLGERAGGARQPTPRPRKVAALDVRASEYQVSTGTPTEQRSKITLTRVPDVLKRRDSAPAVRTLRRQEPQASDFFECTNPNQRPATTDCKVIVSQILSTDDELIIAANSCLVYSYKTCQAFFCSLCQTLDTTTQFIGSQLDTVDALCVENGQAGTIVGEAAPQWDAGFTYAGQGLPSFDVC